jgi:phospholipase D1/2
MAANPAFTENTASLFRPGLNCHRVARARRAALLIDGEAYFRAFAQAALQAKSSVVLVGWDFHSQTRLHLNLAGVPDQLGDFLNFLLQRHRGLKIFILAWDYPAVFGRGRERPMGSDGGWQPHARIRFHYDSNCPFGAAFHQKIVVIDGALAFCGGMDFTTGRWDTPAHAARDPRRANVGEIEPYDPVHDTMLAVDSGAAHALLDIARQRWRIATGRALPVTPADRDAWPQSVTATFRDVEVGAARTVPAHEPSRTAAVTEVENLYLDMIAAARRYIYIENQYFTARTLGDALAARLAEVDGPEIIVVTRLSSSGWLEAPTMSALRTVLLRKLRAADTQGRFQAWFPTVQGECCDVHSKLMLVDDQWLRVGSANFASRSMGLDTECDLVIAACGSEEARAGMITARNALLAEHLGVAPGDLEKAIEAAGSLGGAVTYLAQDSGRTLRPFEYLDDPSAAVVALAEGMADPERPVGLDELIAGLGRATGLRSMSSCGSRGVGLGSFSGKGGRYAGQ